MCRGLEYAHEQGVVHRDLKPGNVWLTADGPAKIEHQKADPEDPRTRRASITTNGQKAMARARPRLKNKATRPASEIIRSTNTMPKRTSSHPDRLMA